MATFGGKTEEDSVEGQEPPRAADHQSSTFREETLTEEARCSSGRGKAGGGGDGNRDEQRRSRGLRALWGGTQMRKPPAQLSSWPVTPGTRPGASALDTRSAHPSILCSLESSHLQLGFHGEKPDRAPGLGRPDDRVDVADGPVPAWASLAVP